MNKCPLTYQETEDTFSKVGLQRLDPRLTHLNSLEFTSEELRFEASQRSGKISIQGVQPKLSAVLNIKKHKFELVDINGKYIIKPQHPVFSQMPENEDLTMHLAAMTGIETPVHGLIYGKDRNLNYFIQRFDRKILFDYLGRDRLGLSNKIIEKTIVDFAKSINGWEELIKNSFLSDGYKEKYLQLLKARRNILDF